MPSYREYQVVLRPGLQNLIKRPQVKIIRSCFGCLNCKKRKVKCDETKDTCRRCQRRNEACVWPQQARSKQRAKAGDHVVITDEKVNVEDEKVRLEEILPEDENLQEDKADHGNSLAVSHFHKEHTDGVDPFKTIMTVDSAHPTTSPLSPYRADEFQKLESILQFQILPAPLPDHGESLDAFFLTNFASKFLPPFAQVHFSDRQDFQSMVLKAAHESPSLREVFIACGASFVASENALQRNIAHKRYSEAISKYMHSLKSDIIERHEPWLFIAAQVLQILCLREPFADSNATRCAFHFALAHKFVANRLSRMMHNRYVSPLEKQLMENFIFHYPLIIFFCDHTRLRDLVPNPFQFYLEYQSDLFLVFWEEALAEYGLNPLVAFHIAAKCSWSCRLSLPLNDTEKATHTDLLTLAQKSLQSSSPISSTDPKVQVTNSVTTIVLNSAIILLSKMINPEDCTVSTLQPLVETIRSEMDKACHVTTVFPIWSLMIAACASATDANRMFFRAKLEALYERSKSKLIERILVQLDDVWAVCEAEEPFELLFDTEFLSQICT